MFIEVLGGEAGLYSTNEIIELWRNNINNGTREY